MAVAAAGGAGVLVGPPRATAARHRLPDPDAVRGWDRGSSEDRMSDINLWPIGNCQVSALVNSGGRFVWGCVPRVDGDPAFSALLAGDKPETGFWSIELDGCTATTQHYLRNTPILCTRHEDAAGNAVEVIDFSAFRARRPRLSPHGVRPHRPPQSRAPRASACACASRPTGGGRPASPWGRTTSAI
ncbi:trehalase-like domain-containing protein [Sphingomonas sp. MMS24-JH45]